MQGLSPPPRLSRAFTLVEMLVSITIMVVLVGVLVPVLAKARDAARGNICRSNLRQLVMGTLQYADEFKNFLPYSYEHPADPAIGEPGDNVMWFNRVGREPNGADRIRRSGILPYDSTVFTDTIWNCPYTPEIPDLALAPDDGSCQYALAWQFTGQRRPDTSWHFFVSVTIDEIAGRWLMSDASLNMNGAGNHILDVHVDASTGPSEHPWPTKTIWNAPFGDVPGKHSGNMSIAGVDGHVRSWPENWDDVPELREEYRRSFSINP